MSLTWRYRVRKGGITVTRIKSPLAEADQKTTGAALQGALADVVDLSLTAKQAHWNVVGQNFRSLHLQLDETVATARAAADVLAERASAIGVPPDARAATVAAESGLAQFPDGPISCEDVVSRMVDIYESLASRMRERIAATDEADPVTQDQLIGIEHDLEKQSWMFKTQLG